jgi:acetyl-CoA carboxylase alpha subunit
MLFLTDLGAFDDARALEALLARTELVVAYGEGEVRGLAAAALLFADYAVLHENATLQIDVPEAWAAVAWRLGRRTIAWAAGGQNRAEVVDEITAKPAEAWQEEWTRHRSVIALDAAAMLIRSRGGDSLERAEFARLFAIGEPQKGLGAFLAKVRPSYSTENL